MYKQASECHVQSGIIEVSRSVVGSQMREQWGMWRHWEGGPEVFNIIMAFILTFLF